MKEGWLRSVVDGVIWPAIPNSAAGKMLALQFQFERSQWMNPAEIWSQQRRQMRALLRHAVDQVPYYGQRLSTYVAQLPEQFSPADFARLPLLKRANLQGSFTALCAKNLPAGHGDISPSATSGSTGEPVRYLTTSMAAFFWQAFSLREHLWHRRAFDSKMLVLRVGGEPEVLSNWFGEMGAGMMQTGPCVLVPAGWTIDRQLDRIVEEQPGYLLGYASNIRAIFWEAARRGVTMPWLREVRTFGEAVPAGMRDYFRERWKLPLSDVYSAREIGYMAIQCPDCDAYHVQSESAYLEIIDDMGSHCKPGQIGRVVVTPLHNFATPLLRYDIGDYAEVGEHCECGRGLPVLKRIYGRTRNILHMPDGSKRWPPIGPAKLLEIAPIRRFNIVQKTREDVEIRLVIERPLIDSEVRALHAHFTSHFGYPFNWKIVVLDDIPARPGDKFEDFVSEVG